MSVGRTSWVLRPPPSQYEQDLKKEIDTTIGTALGQNPQVVKTMQEYLKERLANNGRVGYKQLGNYATFEEDQSTCVIQPLPEPPPEAKPWWEDYKGKLED